MSELSYIRPLSIHEASFPVYAQFSPGAGNIVSLLSLNGTLTSEAFVKAVNVVVSSNEALRAMYVGVADDKSNAAFQWMLSVRNPRIELISLENGEDIEVVAHACMERLMNEPFVAEEPLCRFLLLSGVDKHRMFACVNHAALDGSSIIGLLRRLVEHLVNPDAPSQPCMPFQPALWDYMPDPIRKPLGIFSCLSVFAMLIQLQKQADKGIAFSVESPAPASEHRCMVVRRELNVEQSLGLVTLSKQERVSVHGLLGAAVARAFMDHLRTENGESFPFGVEAIKIPLVSTMDLRRRTAPRIEDNVLGCFSSGATHRVHCSTRATFMRPKDYALLGAEVDRTLGQEIEREQHWKLLRIYKTLGLGGMKKIFRDAAEKPMSMPLSLANVGRLQFPSSGTLKVMRFEGAPAFHANGPSVNVQSYMVNDQLTLSYTAASPQMSRATLEYFADRVVFHLGEMV